MLDSSRNDEVEREVKDEWELVYEGGVEKEKEEEKCMPSDNIESRIEEVGEENRYGKRKRMVSIDDLVLDSTICLNVDIQQENLQQYDFPKSYCSNKEDGREEINKVLDVIYALLVTIKLKTI